MNNHEYLKKLSLIAHWKFSREEAEEIIDDYKLFSADMHGDELLTRLGNPSQALVQIQSRTRYSLWLAAFLWMAFCMIGLTIELFSFAQNRYWEAFLLGTGFIISIGWFLKTERGYVYKRPLSKGIPILLLIMLAAICCEWWLFREGNRSSSLQYAKFFRTALLCTGCTSALAGMSGLVMAKLRDRRWRAVYTAALTVLANSVFIFSICHDIHLNRTLQGWWSVYILPGGCIAAAGLFAAIISLF